MTCSIGKTLAGHLGDVVAFFYAPAFFNGGGAHIVSPLSVRPYVTQMVSVRYLLKGLVYWIEIYTQVYNHKM